MRKHVLLIKLCKLGVEYQVYYLYITIYADGEAVWKRRKNLEFIFKQLQGTMKKVEESSYKWYFKFSIDKAKIMVFTKKTGW